MLIKYIKPKKYFILTLFISVLTIIIILSIVKCLFLNINLKNDFIQNSDVTKFPNNSNNINSYINDNGSLKEVINISQGKLYDDVKSFQKIYKEANAFLSIPILGLYNAPIKNGTSQEIMKKYIGHFENTSFDTGNIGLASHNRGMGANYFEKVYKLKEGDCIFYTYKNCTKKYLVDKKMVIDSYDWSYLGKTDNNILTIITCIENKPNLRLCVQAIQI